jgi:hypothetical protein
LPLATGDCPARLQPRGAEMPIRHPIAVDMGC